MIMAVTVVDAVAAMLAFRLLWRRGLRGAGAMAAFGLLCLAVAVALCPPVISPGVVAALAAGILLPLTCRSLLRGTSAPAPALGMGDDDALHAKASFLANMNHELRTPLNAVIGFAQVMRQEALGPLGSPRYREYAAGIEESGQHLLDLVEDLLDVARLEAGQVSLREEELDPAQVMDRVARLVRPKADGARVMLFHDPEQELPVLWADARRLRQVLLNLLSNAVKFTPAGGLVELRGEILPDGGFAFVVRDTGIGIQPDELSKVMEVFGQAEDVYRRSHSGPGLGLPLAHGLMQLHGGGLTMESQPEHGTTVRAELPYWRVRGAMDAGEIGASG